MVLQNYLYSNGALTAFPANFTGAGINTIGQVVGSVGLNCQNVNLDAGGGCAFATYVSGVLTTYPIYDGVLDPAVGNQAQSMNASGVIVGDWTFTHGEGYPLVLTNGVFSALQFPGSTCGGNVATTAGVAYAINDAGQIAGMLPYDPDAAGNCESHAFLFSNGIYSDIGPGYAYALNASGQVTGISYILGGPPNYYQTSPEVFLYSNGTTTRLGALAGDDSSEGRAINASGQMVGDSWLSTASPTIPRHAFLYNGALQDLNALVLSTDPLQPYVTLTEGRGINDNGLVVANGVDSRDKLQHVYLLQVPLLTMAPGSLTFASQSAGTVSAAQSVMLTNVGAAALALGSISTTGNFTQTNDCGASLAPNGACKVMVTFDPSNCGILSGALTIIAAGDAGHRASFRFRCKAARCRRRAVVAVRLICCH